MDDGSGLPICPARCTPAEERGFDGRRPDAEQSAARWTGAEPVDGAGRDEDEGARSDSFCGSAAGVEGVGAFEHVEGLRFIMRVRWVVEAGVLPGFPERPVAAGVGAGRLA